MLSQAIQSAVDRTLRLEYDQALHLRNILAESQRELNAKLPKLAAGSLNAANLSSVKAQIDATVTALEQRLASGMAIASSMVTGLESAQSITASQAGIPSDSSYWLFSPVLNVEVLAQQRAESVRLIRNVTDELRSKLLTQVQVSYSQGEGIGQMMRRLTGKGLSDLTGKDGVFRAAKYRAEMIGRTTVNELVNKAGLEAFKQLDIEFPELHIIKEWITTSDKRTSPRCISLNGQKRELNEAFVAADGWSGQNPPSHTNCRSRVISVPKRYNANSEKQWRIRYNQKPAERKENDQRKQIYLKQQAREESRKLPKTLQELTKPPVNLPMSKQSARMQAVNEALGNVPDANKALRDLIDSDPLKFDRIMARQNELMQRSLDSLVNSDFARQLIADSDPMLRDFMQNIVLEFDAPKVNTSAEFEAYYKRTDQEITLGKQLNSSSVRLHEYGHYLDHQMQKASQRVTEDNQFEYWSSANASGLMFNQDYRDGRVILQNIDVEVLERKSENAYEDFQEGDINADKMQRYTNLKDLVGSMTINRVSYGHRTEYYRNFGNAETEVFANSFQTYAQNDPDIREIYESIPYVPEVITYTNRQIRRSILDGSPYPLRAGRFVEPVSFEDVDIDLDL